MEPDLEGSTRREASTIHAFFGERLARIIRYTCRKCKESRWTKYIEANGSRSYVNPWEMG